MSSTTISSSIIPTSTSISSFISQTTSSIEATTTTTKNDNPIISVPDFSWNTSYNSQLLYDKKHAGNIGSQFTVCVIAGLVCFLAFCIFRTRIPVLFSPRAKLKRHKPPELPTSLFGWIWPLIKIDDDEMLTKVGLDALLMLKFIAMSIKIFGLCTIFGLIVFIPMTLTSHNFDDPEDVVTAIDRVSFTAIEDNSPKLIAYLVFAYVFTLITFFFLNQSFNDYVYLRAKYLLKQSKSLVARSVIVTGVPEVLRSDEKLANYFEHLGIGTVESCYVVRTIHRLDELIKQRAKALKKLENAYARYWGNPCRIPGYDADRIVYDIDLYKKVTDLAEKAHQLEDMSSSDEEEPNKVSRTKTLIKKTGLGNTTFFQGLVDPEKKVESKRPTVRIGGFVCGPKVDAIEYYTKLFNDLDKVVNEQRKSPNFELTNVAFVTFDQMSSAIIASQIAIHPAPFVLRTKMACEPRDILWSAIGIKGRERIIREAIIWTITVIICITWSFPVGVVSSMLSISTIAKLNSNLGESLENNPVAKLVLNSFVPPLVLNIFTSVLPLFFDAMGYYQGLKSRSAVAESTLSKQYFFLIFFTLIFYSVIDTTALTLITDITNDPKKIPEFLADSLPGIAPFFINYTILQGFLIMPLNLLLLGAIIVRGFNHLFLCRTPREYAQNRSPWSFNYGIGYPAPLLVFAIVFEYSLICPLILLFGTVYFCFTYLVYKYQFLYVYFRPYEAAGKLWTMTIPRIIFTLVLFQLTMMGLFILRGSYILGGLVVPLIALTFLFRFILYRAYKKNAMSVPMQLIVDNLDENNNLITPSDNEEDSSDEDDDDSVTDSAPSEDSPKSNEPIIRVEDTSQEVRNRWKKAALTAVNPKPHSVIGGTRPQKKILLDEDDYRAIPDHLTDYRQPPMNLNPGLLDTGLKTYVNPLLVGHVPQLWLPVSKSPDAQDKQEAAEQAHQRKKAFLRHEEGGGMLAERLAEILRKLDTPTHSDDALVAHQYAESIVSQKTAKMNVLGRMFKKKQKQQNQNLTVPTPAEQFREQHQHDEALDQLERGQSDDRISNKTVHKTYYHHPEKKRRRSHVIPRPVELLKATNASSPAMLGDEKRPTFDKSDSI